MDHPPGTIVVISGDLGRYTAFTQSIAMLKMPEGTRVAWCVGADITANLNKGLDDRVGEWVWFMGDDHVFGHDILERLLDHDIAAVAPVVFKRKPPYTPLIYKAKDDEAVPVEREEMPESGLYPVLACAGAGLLIKNYVLDQLTPPYYECGQINPSFMAEDIWFQQKIRKAGYQIFVDFDTVMGHQTPAVVWPVRLADGTWKVVLDPNCTVPGTSAPPSIKAA